MLLTIFHLTMKLKEGKEAPVPVMSVLWDVASATSPSDLGSLFSFEVSLLHLVFSDDD